MEVKGFMGVANIVSIFEELNLEERTYVLAELYKKAKAKKPIGDFIPWINATSNKPPRDVKVFAKGGFRQEMYSMMLVWDGEHWFDSIKYEHVGTVSHFFIP